MQVVSSGFLRISISPDDRRSLQTRFKRAKGCEDKELMAAAAVGDLEFPEAFAELGKPWTGAAKKIYTSDYVENGFDNIMFELKVPGLGETKIKAVLAHLVEQECLSFPFGGSVRDQLLGKTPGDLDMDSNCDAETLHQICVDKWVCADHHPAKVCTINGRKTVMHIGLDEAGETEQLDAANWENNFFGDGTGLEYTTNAIGYFTNPTTGQIIIDVTGDGVHDTCESKIALPVAYAQRNAWFTNSKNGYYVVYRAWKLRAKEFDFINVETEQFLVTKAKDGFRERPGKFKKFYCTVVLKGEYDGAGCTIAETDCPAALESKEIYDDLFKTDLTVQYWNANAVPLIETFDDNCPPPQMNAQDDVGLFQAIWNYNY